VTPHSVHALLSARSALPPGAEHAERWRAAVGTLSADDEAWLIGSAGLAQLMTPAPWSQLTVTGDYHVGSGALTLDIRHRQKAAAQLRLELPKAEVCAHLLRDPFSVATVSSLRSDLRFDGARPITFSGDGRRLFAWLADGGVASFAVPQSPRAPSSAPKIFRPAKNETLLACGSRGKRSMFLTVIDGALFMYGAGGTEQAASGHMRSRINMLGFDAPDAPIVIDEWRPGRVFETIDGVVHVARADGQVYRFVNNGLAPRGRALAVEPVPTKGILLAQFAVRIDGEGIERPSVALDHLGGINDRRSWVNVQRSLQRYETHIGYASSLARCVGVRVDDDTVRVVNWPAGGKETELLPGKATWLGMQGGELGPSLILLDTDSRTLLAVGRSHSKVIATLGADVVQTCVSSATERIAVLTRAGDLHAYSLKLQAPVLRVLGALTP
jgi:hypothetical protein